MPIEQLLDVKVFTAARHDRKQSEAGQGADHRDAPAPGSAWPAPARAAEGVGRSPSIRNLFTRKRLDSAKPEYFNSMNQRLDCIPQDNGRMLPAKPDCPP